MFAYCLNNPVGRVDFGGTVSVTHYEGEDPLDKRLLEYGGGGVGSAIASMACVYAASQVSSANRSKTKAVAIVGTSSDDKYSVYFLYAEGGDPNTIVYVGRVKTQHFASRMAYHEKRGRLLAGSIGGLNYDLCRAIEQGGMMYYHTINRGNNLMNQIRGISPTNGNRVIYINAILALVNSGKYPENSFLPTSYWENFIENEFLNVGS